MKTYKLSVFASRSEITTALCSQLQMGKAGEVLIRKGFSQANFTLFLARLAVKAVEAGFDESKLAIVFKQVAASNASQARQACEAIMIEFGEMEKSKDESGNEVETWVIEKGTKARNLESLWGVRSGSGAPDLSLLGSL